MVLPEQYRQHLWGIIVSLLLTGCGSGAVVFAPTPLPPGVSPLAYEHPTGTFSLVLPRNWSAFTQESATLAAASFAPPDSRTPLLEIAVVDTGEAIAPENLIDIVSEYQANVRPDLLRYTEQDRQAMGDGSWRITGIRTLPGGETQPVNTFIDFNGSLVSILEVPLPDDALLRDDLQTIINTLELNPQHSLTAASLAALTDTARASLEIVQVTSWTTPERVFYIGGGVVNHSTRPLSDISVRAVLNTADGTGVAEAIDMTMGHALLPGGFAPFSLRFGQGQPADTVSYTLTAGEGNISTDVAIVGSERLAWDYETVPAPEGQVYVAIDVTGTGDRPVRDLRAVVTAFDASGQLIGAGFAESEDALAPGDTTDLTVLLAEMGGVPVTYEVNVQALPCDDSC